ncbi:MAG: ATP-dependent zinc metalloprotease FtsH [Candidatus Kaelpia aquatica]|nr:ATP-dependent zinc metalloprotease FtsH [Candidatus Kaelpia aquatica]
MEKKKKDKKMEFRTRSLLVWLLLMVLFYMFWQGNVDQGLSQIELKYSEFYKILRDSPGDIRLVVKTENLIRGELEDGTGFRVMIPDEDRDFIALMRENISDFRVEPPKTLLLQVLFSVGPILLFIAFLWFLHRGSRGGAGRIFSFGKIKTRLGTDGQDKITFNDVAGVTEAKEELKEIIDFLTDPKKFQRLGGKIPRGVLLTGPPGTGKTLLAKAVSGEAGVLFSSLSGSDFVEMFVGVGAARVRDLFEQSKRHARSTGKGCIIFIDEIDAVGRQRFSGIGGGHDEREQTLNALLAEMDGFGTDESVIVIAATNRPDVLDSALLRPGRFDRVIIVDSPDVKGREDILKVHVRNKKVSDNINLDKIARQTSGFSGADLANLCNESALLAARRGKDEITMDEMDEAIDRVMAGPQRKSRVINEHEKKLTAFHEAGHALVSLLLPNVEPLHKVSIIPRGMAGGYTKLLSEDKNFNTKGDILDKITVFLAGRVSEELALGEISTGARNDLENATKFARNMVCVFGMSEKLGNVSLDKHSGPVFLGRDLVTEKHYSEKTAEDIDKEIKTIIDQCYHISKQLLEKNREKLYLLANTLLDKETLEGDSIRKLLGIKDKKKDEQDKSS